MALTRLTFVGKVISLLCLILLLRFYLVASFRIYPLVTSFSLILMLGYWVTFLDLGEVVLCRKMSSGVHWHISFCNQSYTI